MVAFIKYQQQVFRLRQNGFAFHRRHHQRMISHHHFSFLNLPTGDKKRALTVVVTVAIQTASFIGAQTLPESVVNGDIGVIAQPVPLVAVEIAF
ncbi:hypothetical protein SDC9_194183 [bioreactor metagenome]|uniref:Uncharacterized protein n=1 Tax=bioreactor metagenome TaxID=1076179 RepID=A0A645I731_9ZZZZ